MELEGIHEDHQCQILPQHWAPCRFNPRSPNCEIIFQLPPPAAPVHPRGFFLPFLPWDGVEGTRPRCPAHTHFLWKACLQGQIPSSSLGLNSSRHTAQICKGRLTRQQATFARKNYKTAKTAESWLGLDVPGDFGYSWVVFPTSPARDLSGHQGQVQLLGSAPEENTQIPSSPRAWERRSDGKKGKTRARDGEGRAGRALFPCRARGSRPVMLENSHPVLCSPEMLTANPKLQMLKTGKF